MVAAGLNSGVCRASAATGPCSFVLRSASAPPERGTTSAVLQTTSTPETLRWQRTCSTAAIQGAYVFKLVARSRLGMFHDDGDSGGPGHVACRVPGRASTAGLCQDAGDRAGPGAAGRRCGLRRRAGGLFEAAGAVQPGLAAPGHPPRDLSAPVLGHG